VYLAGRGGVEIVIPSSVPLFGGVSLAGVDAEISTERLYARASILEIPIGISYEWGGEVKLAHSGKVTIAGGTDVAPQGLVQQPVFDPHSGKFMGTIHYGTNVRQVFDDAGYKGGAPRTNTVSILSEDTIPSATVSAEHDYVIFELAFSGEEKPVQVKDPSGNVYPLAGFDGSAGNYHVQLLSAEDSPSGQEEGRAYIGVPAPEIGKWTFDTDMELLSAPKVYAVSELPRFTNVTAEKTGHEVRVEWGTANIDPEMEVALYLTDDSGTDATVGSGEALRSEQLVL